MTNDAPLLLDVTRLIWRRWVGRHPTGIDRVCLEYLDRYGGVAQAVIQHRRYRRILTADASQALFRLLSDPSRSFRTDFIKGVLRWGLAAGCQGAGRIYLNVGHTGLDDPEFKEWVNEADVRPVYLVHDLIPITHPEFCRAGESDRHAARMRTVLETARGVIGNSQATIDDLARFARAIDLPLPPSITSWLGSARLPIASSYKVDKPTFVMLGTIEARKNHSFILQVWSDLIRTFGPKAPTLLVIGQRGWEAQQAIDLLGGGTLSEAVVEIGDCDDVALAGHLGSARALIFPSLVEGYGMPLIEALQSGVPVIASDLPVFREIGQGVPDLLNPQDDAAWRRAILDFSEPQSSTREKQLDRLKTFEPPTWPDHFAKVDSWLSKL